MSSTLTRYIAPSIAAIMALSATGCVEYDATMLFDMEYPPLAAVESTTCGGTTQLAFTGEFVFQDPNVQQGAIFRGAGAVDLTELATGQPITNAPVAVLDAAGMCTGFTSSGTNPPGVYEVTAFLENRLNDSSTNDGSELRLDQNAIQVTQIVINYKFGSGEVVFERTFSKILRSGGERAVFSFALINGLGELQLIQQQFTQEAAQLGGSIITVPVEIQVIGSSTAGTPSESNVFSFPVTMCANCDEVGISPVMVPASQ